MNKIGLRGRLFLSHLLVMLIGVTSLVIIGKIYSPKFFVSNLEQLEGPGFRLQYIRTRLVKGFEIAWNRSTFWSVLAGTTAAVGLSYWLTKRITKPLTEMEEITQKFASGEWSERMSPNDIPELNQLAMSFNQMAASLQNVEKGRRELVSDLTHELRTPLTIVRGYLEEIADGNIAPSPEIYQQLAKETKRLERVRSEFLGNVSHELRTPIFSIQGYLETLLDGALDDPNVARQFTQRAYSNAERLNILLGDLINISKIESGEMRLSFRYFYINEIIKDTVQALEFEAEQRQVKIYCDIESSAMATVFGDKERVLQVITNLVQNAIKYNIDGGEVNISTIVREKEVLIKVSDTGIGIPQEHLPRIFERFYRVDKDRSRAVGGTGLGLAIVKHILEAHQSQFSAESDIGKGTTISFTLKR